MQANRKLLIMSPDFMLSMLDAAYNGTPPEEILLHYLDNTPNLDIAWAEEPNGTE